MLDSCKGKKKRRPLVKKISGGKKKLSVSTFKMALSKHKCYLKKFSKLV